MICYYNEYYSNRITFGMQQKVIFKDCAYFTMLFTLHESPQTFAEFGVSVTVFLTNIVEDKL